jgi:hypothetical protein
MARGPNLNNRLGINQNTPFGRAPFSVTIQSEGIKRLAVRFGQQVARADPAIRGAWLELASDVHAKAGRILREETTKHGRPQRDQRGQRRQLQYLLDNEPTENLTIIRNQGFQFPNTKAMDASPAARYWRQVERPSGDTYTMTGLFVLPPIGKDGSWNKSQWQEPNGENGPRDAVKFQQFRHGAARTITAHLGPKSGGYRYFERAGLEAKREWRKGRAKAVFIAEFRAQGLDILARIAARREFDAGRGTAFESPMFFSG